MLFYEQSFRGNIPSGWNGRRGQTVNPYVLNQNPSGSSSGSAVSIAANLAAISLGTETDGSIISPSTRNAIVGLKPTLDVVSTKGVIPLAFSNDVVRISFHWSDRMSNSKIYLTGWSDGSFSRRC